MKARIEDTFEATCNWQVWRAILDRITASPHYRFDDPKKGPYLKLAKFASAQLAIFNAQKWGADSSVFIRKWGFVSAPTCGPANRRPLRAGKL